MSMNWQKEHERLLEELNKVAGRHVYDMYRDTSHLTGEKLALAWELNRLNTLAVENYYKASVEWRFKHDLRHLRNRY